MKIRKFVIKEKQTGSLQDKSNPVRSFISIGASRGKTLISERAEWCAQRKRSGQLQVSVS